MNGQVVGRRDEEGFALFLVVILLFTVGVLGATGYQIAVLSSDLALQGKEGQRALSIARAGVQRYMARIGVPADTATYSMDGGDAVVTSRLVAQTSDTTSMYLVKGEGVYLDPASENTPARRVVYQFAERREVPFDFEAVITLASGSLVVQSNGRVDGDDQASNGACSQTSVDIAGAMVGPGSVTYSGSALEGSPDTIRAGAPDPFSVGTYQAVIDSIGIAWDVLTDPAYTPDFEDRWPTGVAADSFPVIRFNGNRTASGWQSGRGVLIVDGVFRPMLYFDWEGIILAEEIRPVTSGYSWYDSYRVDGIVVSGLGGGAGTWTVTQYADIEYNRCHAYRAARSLGYFRPVEDAWWEGT